MTRSASEPFSIAGRAIGPDHPAYVIAEVGINHGGSEALCAEMITAAARAGADAVKLQTVRADESYHPDSESHAIFREAELSRAALARLMAHAESEGTALFSTPGEPASLALIAELGMPAIKISSGLLTNIPLIRLGAKTGLPLILSTGMAYVEEIEEAVAAAREAGASQIAILQCTSLYPAPASALNLRAIGALAERFGTVAGYSDHHEGMLACIAAVAAGASIVEKHFSTTPDAAGADHAISVGPGDFARMVADIRAIEAMAGQAEKAPVESELPLRDARHRRLVAARDLAEGDTVSAEDLHLMRLPGDRPALPARRLDDVSGRRLTRAVPRLSGITADVIEGFE